MEKPGQWPKISRRIFFRMTGMVAGGLALTPFLLTVDSVGVQAADGTKWMRPGMRGAILESFDQGKTWFPAVNFGPDFAVENITQAGGMLVAHLKFLGQPFALKSTDGHTWTTLEWQPPSGHKVSMKGGSRG